MAGHGREVKSLRVLKRIRIPASIYGNGCQRPCTLTAIVSGSSLYPRYRDFEMADGDDSLPDGEYSVVLGMTAFSFRKAGNDWAWVRQQS